MSRCGIEIRGRARKLRVNYRTTARVRAFAVGALTGETFDDMDGGENTLDRYRSLRVGVEPQIHFVKSKKAHHQAITVRAWLGNGAADEVCVAAYTNRDVQALQEALADADVDTVIIKRSATVKGEGMRLATFHRLKGLEFPRVLLSGVQEGKIPIRPREYYTMDETDKRNWDRQQRCLQYVAATRARDELVVTGYGRPSPFLA